MAIYSAIKPKEHYKGPLCFWQRMLVEKIVIRCIKHIPHQTALPIILRSKEQNTSTIAPCLFACYRPRALNSTRQVISVQYLQNEGWKFPMRIWSLFLIGISKILNQIYYKVHLLLILKLGLKSINLMKRNFWLRCVKTAQQSVHWTAGILRRFQAFFWLRVFSAPKQNPRPTRWPAGNPGCWFSPATYRESSGRGVIEGLKVRVFDGEVMRMRLGSKGNLIFVLGADLCLFNLIIALRLFFYNIFAHPLFHNIRQYLAPMIY